MIIKDGDLFRIKDSVTAESTGCSRIELFKYKIHQVEIIGDNTIYALGYGWNCEWVDIITKEDNPEYFL